MSNPRTDLQQLTAYLAGYATPDARAKTQWRLEHDAAFATYAAPAILGWSVGLKQPEDAERYDGDAAWDALRQRLHVSPPRPSATVLSASRSWAMPMFCLILTVLIVLSTTLQWTRALGVAHQYAATQSARTITLPDGSTVLLAPGATLSTDSAFSHGTRTVELGGSGQFTVRADPRHPFIVCTNGVDAVAVGTVFRVAGEQGNSVKPAARVYIGVTQGKVVVQRLDAHGHREILAILGPGEETWAHAALSDFRAGITAAAEHKSIAEAYQEDQAIQAARALRDSFRAMQQDPLRHTQRTHNP